MPIFGTTRPIARTLGAAAIAVASMFGSAQAQERDLLNVSYDIARELYAALNPALNAVVLPQEDVARRAIAAGVPRGPFAGVPFLIKDLGCEAVDFPSHNGSRLLANTRYDRDSPIFARIRATGVVTWGRTTSPEGGIGIWSGDGGLPPASMLRCTTSMYCPYHSGRPVPNAAMMPPNTSR